MAYAPRLLESKQPRASVPFRHFPAGFWRKVLLRARSTSSAEGGLKDALRQARLAEAAHFEAALDLRDSKSIRLQLLKDELLPLVISSPTAADLFDLALIPGESPRLWIDLITFVVMEPDHRTYRLFQDRQNGREILFETASRPELVEAIKRQMAHQLVARQRQVASTPQIPAMAGYSISALLLAWLSGFALGALILLAVAISLGRLDF